MKICLPAFWKLSENTWKGFCFLKINIISKVLGNTAFLLHQLDIFGKYKILWRDDLIKRERKTQKRSSKSYLIANSTAGPFTHPEKGKRIQEEYLENALQESVQPN